jgi:hypothetical protein
MTTRMSEREMLVDLVVLMMMFAQMMSIHVALIMSVLGMNGIGSVN